MLLTIFTPTYNRANLLSRLYDSLCLQSSQNFEWIIVDDGSTDNTDDIVKTFISEAKISIIYYRQENAGKHVAINKGVSLAKGDLFFIVDSDDYLTPGAVDFIKENYKRIEDVDCIAGLAARCGYTAENPIGSLNFKSDITETVFDFRYRRKIFGDMAEIIKTKVMKDFLFPRIDSERFMPEAVVWNRIGLKYRILWLPDIIYIAEYLDGGLTDNIFFIRKKSPEGALLFYKELQSMPVPFLQKIRANINYWRFAKFSNRSFSSKFKDVNPAFSFFGLPLSIIFLIRDPK